MKYQLFQQMPDENFLLRLLNCYDIADINDNKEFSKCDLIDLQIVNRIENLIPELVLYYLQDQFDCFDTTKMCCARCTK